MEYNYQIFPEKVDNSVIYSLDHNLNTNESIFVAIAISLSLGGIWLIFYNGFPWVLICSIISMILFFVIRKSMNESKDTKNTKKTIDSQVANSNYQAEVLTQKVNLILMKSQEIYDQILPYFEFSAAENLKKAKVEFIENAYSPFWSEIEGASRFLAYYKEALNQLCFNSELYTASLQNKRHNFPLPFPFATNISISRSFLDDYNTLVRKAQTNPTFSIIWEQRRNSNILSAGFSTLEYAVKNMTNEISYAITELSHSLTTEIRDMKYVQKEQFQNFQLGQHYLTQTLNSMDSKLYYIQWRQKPLGTFHHR